jgi:hypothetical protein
VYVSTRGSACSAKWQDTTLIFYHFPYIAGCEMSRTQANRNDRIELRATGDEKRLLIAAAAMNGSM